MFSRFQRLRILSRENYIQPNFIFEFQSRICHSHRPILHYFSCFAGVQDFMSPKNQKPEKNMKDSEFYFLGRLRTSQFVHSNADSADNIDSGKDPDDQTAILVQNIIKFRRDKSTVEIEGALDRCGLVLTENLVLNVLRRHSSDWKPAYSFFNWVCKGGGGNSYSPGSDAYNEILDILGKMLRFEELTQVLEKMSNRSGLVSEATYGILIRRYAAAHEVDKAITFFRRRKEFGLELDSVAFQTLLMWLCRYKHVEVAETLFYSDLNEFQPDIKTMNIILNGWCTRANVREAKRFWNDIIKSECQPDMFTYATFINSLTKKGKLGLAMKLFRAMWDKGCNPDVTICNCVIDALCFKKRIPEALEVFQEMNEKGCLPNVMTYNSLIKHMCKIRRMKHVYELLDEMEQKKGSCLPNAVTYSFLLKSLKKPEEVPSLLERIEKNGCRMNGDMYNLVLKLYMEWDCQESVRNTWDEMERNGLGPDRRSYTIMIHGFYDKGRKDTALHFFREMISKGILPEPRTEMLVNSS